MALLHIIPNRAELSRDPLYISFPCPAHINTTVHFIESGETCCRVASQVWHRFLFMNVFFQIHVYMFMFRFGFKFIFMFIFIDTVGSFIMVCFTEIYVCRKEPCALHMLEYCYAIFPYKS
jgi:hypothetical protein